MKRIGTIFLAILLMVIVVGMLTANGRQVDPEEYFADPQTIALAEAMLSGDTSRMEELVGAGADPNARGTDGMSLAEWEIMREGRSALRTLLRLGADPAAPGWHGGTAMHLAAQYQNDSYLRLLVEVGGDVDAADGRMARSPIFNALMARRPDNVRFLLEHGATLDFADRNGVTPLQLAARINDFDHVLQFLQFGADPLASDRGGATFQSAIFSSDPDLLHPGALAARNGIIAFLEAEGIPLDPKARR
ncbi:MAG: ankyrin repeat domain-containing protein [Candidatus Devosia phytovorans]|uniref:Ankyrin repeat domain-containing protein n=1 Tax=Candidatus Devosia phytovorans TaxID=3121372 RepID=A0AAJ6AYC4_9HYPH|nr:ankyrin repeat domain-containing protein [Devosia sp.]WEK03425.1 MAG: ankyrin repeat domain-containing protein [Devosia sp.]